MKYNRIIKIAHDIIMYDINLDKRNRMNYNIMYN